MTTSRLRKHYQTGIPKTRQYFKTWCHSCQKVTEHQRTLSAFVIVDNEQMIRRYGPCLACFHQGRDTWNEQLKAVSPTKKIKEERPEKRKEALLA